MPCSGSSRVDIVITGVDCYCYYITILMQGGGNGLVVGVVVGLVLVVVLVFVLILAILIIK